MASLIVAKLSCWKIRQPCSFAERTVVLQVEHIRMVELGPPNSQRNKTNMQLSAFDREVGSSPALSVLPQPCLFYKGI